MSEFTVRELRNPAHLREIDLIRVKSKDRPVTVYESLGYRVGDPSLGTLLAAYAGGLEAYRARNWRAAEAAFSAALCIDPADGLSAMYRGRCRIYSDAPPPREWDGVWVLTEK